MKRIVELWIRERYRGLKKWGWVVGRKIQAPAAFGSTQIRTLNLDEFSALIDGDVRHMRGVER